MLISILGTDLDSIQSQIPIGGGISTGVCSHNPPYDLRKKSPSSDYNFAALRKRPRRTYSLYNEGV